jgi:hypothetical protein
LGQTGVTDLSLSVGTPIYKGEKGVTCLLQGTAIDTKGGAQAILSTKLDGARL